MIHGFEYEVEIYFSLTLDEAKFLQELASLHYDSLVQRSGTQGVINALVNDARWTQEGTRGEFRGHLIKWGDVDLMRKCMEQSWMLITGNKSHDAFLLAEKINSELEQASVTIQQRHRAINAAYPNGQPSL